MRRKSRLVIMQRSLWVAEVQFGYDTKLSQWMKQFPGCNAIYNGKKFGGWTFPADLVPQLEAYAASIGYTDFYHGVKLDIPELESEMDTLDQEL